MTFVTLSIAIAIASPTPADCPPLSGAPTEQRVFTNADLDRMAACRYQTGAESEVRADPPDRNGRPARRATKAAPSPTSDFDPREADWRARWRSVDQKTRKLRSEAFELRQEAAAAIPRDPKKPPTPGRRSPSLLITRALRLEAEAKELEDEFQERARREGALPGWLRPKAH